METVRYHRVLCVRRSALMAPFILPLIPLLFWLSVWGIDMEKQQ